MLKITARESKKRKIWSCDSSRSFFLVRYDVSHENKTGDGSNLLWDDAERVAQVAYCEPKFLGHWAAESKRLGEFEQCQSLTAIQKQ